jgi:hypothetical protein
VIVATVAAGLAVRRAGRVAEGGGGGAGVTVAAWIVALLILLYGVVLWLMASKPT